MLMVGHPGDGVATPPGVSREHTHRKEMRMVTTAKKAAPKRTTSTRRKPPGVDLSHLIPDQVFADEYVSRKIADIPDLDLLRYAMLAKDNTLLAGPTGPGKTSLVLAYAATDQIPLVTIQCNGAVDPNTFWGGLAFDEHGVLKGWQDSEVTEVIEYGGLLYLDEVNFLPPKIAAVFHGLLDKRRQITIPELGNKVIKAHETLQLVAAYNPDYEGTKPLNPAFKNRFRHKVRFEYDREVESQLVYTPPMLEIADKLRAAHKRGDVDTPVSTNMLIEFEVLAVDLGYDYAVQNFLNAFSEDERSGVSEAFDMYSDQIKDAVKEMARMADSES